MRSQLAVLVLLALAVCRPANGMQHGGPPGGGGAGGSGGAGTDRARPGGPGMGGEIPPPAQEMRPQQPRPTDCASLQCKNGGLCQMNANGPFCNCSLVAFCGVACGQAEAECVAKDANREKLQAGTALAGQAKEELAKAKAKCADPAMTMLCPKDVPGGRNGTCVGFMADCFPTAADMTAYREIKNNSCPVGQKLCDQEGICVDVRVSCAPADKCPATKAFRCVDWACADNAQACVALAKEKGPPACAEGQQRCPDGLCYPGTGGVKECVKQVTWLGCPPGSMQCNGGAKGVCAADEASCTEVVGCASPLVKCGFQRNAVTGKPLLNETTGKFVADCRDVCPVSIDRPPKDTTKPLDPREGGELEAMSADGSSAVKLKLPKNAFKVGDSFDTPVNFSVTSVPDSLLQNGAFAAHFNRGALLGALITIEPSAEVQIVGGMILDIPILDAWANSDAAKCLLILENTKMIAIRDINNVSEIPESLGTCSKGYIGNCSCLQNVTHFSTFAVVDDTVS